MFCKKCGNRLTEGETVCAHCGAPVSAQKPFASQWRQPAPLAGPTVHKKPQQELPLPETPKAKDAAAEAEAAQTPVGAQPSAAETQMTPPAEEAAANEETQVEKAGEPAAEAAFDEKGGLEERSSETEERPFEQESANEPGSTDLPEEAQPQEPAAEARQAETPAAEPPAESAPATAPAAEPAAETPHVTPHGLPVRESRKARRSGALVKALCVLCALAIVALTCVNAFTDVFKTDNDAVKTVAFSGLAEADKQSAAAFLSKFSVFYGETIDFEELSLYAFLDLLQIGDPNGLYASFFPAPKLITDKADPADRFKSGDGYRYYKIPLSSLQEIASLFDITLVGCANRADYYYVKNNFYFAATEPTKTPAAPQTLDVRSSRRTEDGNYYLSCRTSNGTDVYAMVSLTKQNEENQWKLLSLSALPLFTEDGLPTEQNKDKTLDYEMRQSVITAKADDNTVYARYVIDYPYFKDITSRTAMTVNTIYHESIKSYQQQAKSAEEAYQKYRKKGYDKSLLPGYIYVVSTVTFNKNGTISLLEEVTTYTPETVAKAKKKAADAAEAAAQTGMAPKEVFDEQAYLFPTVTYSGYTIDTETGETLKKDEVFGGDYRTYQKKLYEIYAASTGETGDSEAIGQAIYGSTWFLSSDGIRFCYQGPKGYVQFVTLPYDDVPYTFETKN